MSDDEKGRIWLKENVTTIFAICLADDFSWLRFDDNSWRIQKSDNDSFEETKRYIAVLIDNTRTYEDERYRIISRNHKDWLGIYIRNQNLF